MIKKHNEFEAKCMLSFEDYLKLLQYFRVTEADGVKQTNGFFDTRSLLLNQNNITLRTRAIKNVDLELTLKTPIKENGRAEISIKNFEESQHKTLLQLGIISNNDIVEALANFDISGESYYYQGELTTLRTEIPHHGCLVALDHSFYCGEEDYEIEVERKEENADEKLVLKEILEALGIEYKEGKSKRSRFFQKKMAIK